MRKWSSLSLLLVFVIGIAGGAIGCAKLVGQEGVTDPAALTQGVSSSLSSNTKLNSTGSLAPVLPAAGDIDQPKDNEQQVINDFKNDFTYTVKAWKNAKDVNDFRQILSMGFSGSLLDQKVKDAEEFITEAEGVDIIPLNWGSVKVTKLESNKAIIEAEISYAGYEYNLSTGVRGDKFDEVKLHNEYTLEMKDNQWFITGERAL